MNRPSNHRSEKCAGRLGDGYPDAPIPKVDPSGLKMNPPTSIPHHPTHIECAIAQVIGTHKAAILSVFVEKVFRVASMICVPAIFGATLVMATQRPPIENIALKQNSIPTITVKEGLRESFQVTSPIVLDAQVMRARFMAVLRDARGANVYVWPIIEAENPMTLMGGTSYRMPSSLPPGEYTLHVQVIYKLNPLVSGQVRTDIARVVITN